ncbi:MAG: bifunctional UDP-N-acetylglucosamine diphosphorylase/glucosamine-1-phosphate N-acetyltransferase GlmU [Chloroflexi bacterium]|nr:bifunctional UDP-N-acetylglucosamine diphosphorylase/glucosamine-1-phosphate N-acetyltransferase GlmU [Chloroflexota bacterium]
MTAGRWRAIVLAAGKGTRMRSRLPKVLHPLAGRPLLRYVLDALAAAGLGNPVVVVKHEARQIRQALGPGLTYATQAREAAGTGGATAAARSAVVGADELLVVNGDVPLIAAESFRALQAQHQEAGAAVTILTARLRGLHGLGRVLRDRYHRVKGVVEEAEASPAQRALEEVNVGAYCFRAAWLWEHLPQLAPHAKGELYLTDLVAMAAAEGQPVEGVLAADPAEGLGINDRAQLAQAEALVRDRIRRRHLLAGVTIADPATTYIDADVTIGQDTLLLPQTTIAGNSRIGSRCTIGPGAFVQDSLIGDGCAVRASFVEGATLEDAVQVGPFSHLRPGAYLERGVHIGNYGEVKASRIGRDTQMHHFGYVGDAEVGENVNIGAGTITCNYDGVRKNRTTVEDAVLLGSDTMLVAPVKVGKGAATGAGAVVTHDVEPGTVVAGVPARVLKGKRPPSRPRRGQPKGAPKTS